MESESFLFANKENLPQWNNLHKFLCTTEEPHKGPKIGLTQHKVLCWQFAQRWASLQGKFQLWYIFAYLASKDLGKASCTQICTSGKRRGRKALVPLNACSSHLGKPPKDSALKIIGQTCLRMCISRVPLEVKLHPSKGTGFLFLFFFPFIFRCAS